MTNRRMNRPEEDTAVLIQQLVQQLATKEAQLEQKDQLLEKKDQELTKLQTRVNNLEQILANANRARFGQTSERSKYVADGQLSLFNEAEKECPEPEEEEQEEETTQAASHPRKKKRKLKDKFAGLEVKREIHDFANGKPNCPKCGSVMQPSGLDFLRRELILIPKQTYLVEHYLRTYTCKPCEKETGTATMVKAPAPAPVIPHSFASASSVADVMVSKYMDGMPLYRQEEAWKRRGVELNRNTLANWVILASRLWLAPLYERLKQILLQQNVIHADETTVQVLKEEGRLATSESRMWVYTSGKRSKQQIRLFEYQPGRSGTYAKGFLSGFTGCLVTDGYSGYNRVDTVTRCGCWAHARRKWMEAKPVDETAAKGSKAAEGLEFCTKLFALEAQIEQEVEKNKADRIKLRKERMQPLLDAYWAWLATVFPQKGSKLADAVTYSLNQKPYLMEFLNHAEVELSNNICENAIRPFVVGRKGWLFCDSVDGAAASALVYSLVLTARANDLNPYTYLMNLFTVLPQRGQMLTPEDLDPLLPWQSDMQQLCRVKQSR